MTGQCSPTNAAIGLAQISAFLWNAGEAVVSGLYVSFIELIYMYTVLGARGRARPLS